MVRIYLGCLVLFVCVMSKPSFATISVSINTDAAVGMLSAIQNPDLSHEEAARVARLKGNAAVVRKLNEFSIPVTADDLAEALYAEAHGEPFKHAIDEKFMLAKVKKTAPELARLVHQIGFNPKQFQAAIEKRIGLFVPVGANLTLDGYVVAGGDGNGYAFGSTDFYLNVALIDEFVVAKEVTTHELYHAVQGGVAKLVRIDEHDSDTEGPQTACVATARLFSKVYDEGSAMFVEDISLLDNAHSETGLRKKADTADGLRHVAWSISVLEMSVDALNASPALGFDDVYAVGFYGHGVLYDIGYVMSKAVVEEAGPAGLASLLMQPRYKLVSRYIHLPDYGADADHPMLGPNTVAAIKRIESGCK